VYTIIPILYISAQYSSAKHYTGESGAKYQRKSIITPGDISSKVRSLPVYRCHRYQQTLLVEVSLSLRAGPGGQIYFMRGINYSHLLSQ
jgi:hypothetical protein